MIKFTLHCGRGHQFESWFPDGEDYESQARRGLVVCPECDSKQVRKAPMAPAVLAGRRRRRQEEPQEAPAATQPVAQRRIRAVIRAPRASCAGGRPASATHATTLPGTSVTS